jgi:two-component system, OmpR family, sensor kinase
MTGCRRRTQLIIIVQLAGAISAVVLLVGTVSYIVMVRRQDAQISVILRHAMTYDPPGQPDPCLWVFALRDGAILGADRAPAGLPVRSAMETVATNGTGSQQRTVVAGVTYAVLTQRRGAEVWQTTLDARYLLADRRHLAAALLAAELAGLAAAALTGHLMARRAIAPLDEALVKQRRFVADAGHELRSPLTRLQTRAQLLLRWHGDGLPTDVTSELRQLVEGTRELNEIVEELLQAAQLGATKAAGQPVDLAALASAVIGAERIRADERGLTLVSDSTAQTALVHGVESALRRMISALVDNAMQHTPPGGQIRLTIAPDSHGLNLTVADTGTGFDPADGQYIFERFARGSATSSGHHGLGLALVREVVENHRGTVTATGRPGEGSEFRVWLPSALRHTRHPQQPAKSLRTRLLYRFTVSPLAERSDIVTTDGIAAGMTGIIGSAYGYLVDGDAQPQGPPEHSS